MYKTKLYWQDKTDGFMAYGYKNKQCNSFCNYAHNITIKNLSE